MSQALKTIVEKLSSSDLTVLNDKEIFLYALIESYAEKTNNNTLLNIVKKVKENKIHENARARRDLLLVARAIKVNVLQSAKTMRERTPIISSEELNKLLSGE